MMNTMTASPTTSAPSDAPSHAASQRSDQIVGGWLLLNALLVFAMAIIGAVTRLTESGLSITVWEPLTGWRWPMTAAEWQQAFDLYRQTPQFHQVFIEMSLSEFKFIFFWEWFHRLWGRMIGLVFAIPLVFFWFKGWIGREIRGHILALVILGIAQAFMGWYMVASGLVDRPSVSHYRLAAHLVLALVIYATCLKAAFVTLMPQAGGVGAHHGTAIRPGLWIVLTLIMLTITWGAFVAGLDAGRIYNTFPLMGTYLIPPEWLHFDPLWKNFFENDATVQLMHRLLGYITTVAILVLWWNVKAQNVADRVQWPFAAMAALVIIQAAFGVVTLLIDVSVYFAAMHQGVAMVLLAACIWAEHETRPHAASSSLAEDVQ